MINVTRMSAALPSYPCLSLANALNMILFEKQRIIAEIWLITARCKDVIDGSIFVYLWRGATIIFALTFEPITPRDTTISSQ